MFRFFMLTAIVLAMTLPTAAQLNRDCVLPEALRDYPVNAHPAIDVSFRMLLGDVLFVGVFRPHFNPSSYHASSVTWEFADVNVHEVSAGELRASEGRTLFEPQREVRNGSALDWLYEGYLRLELCNYARYVGVDDFELDDG